jgi:hypothetical protein
MSDTPPALPDPNTQVPDPTNVPTAPEIKISHKDNFWLRKQDAVTKGSLFEDPRPVYEIGQLRALERRYPEGEHKPGLITPGSVTTVRLTDWVNKVMFDVIAYDESSILQVEIPFGRFYLTAATWTSEDKLVEHYVHSQCFLWPLQSVEVFAGYTNDEYEQNVLLDAKTILSPKSWEYFEDTCVKHTTPPPYWTRPPAMWEEQLKFDTEWLGEWVQNRVWDKVYKLDQFLQETFLIQRDPVFIGSPRARIDPMNAIQ